MLFFGFLQKKKVSRSVAWEGHLYNPAGHHPPDAPSHPRYLGSAMALKRSEHHHWQPPTLCGKPWLYTARPHWIILRDQLELACLLPNVFGLYLLYSLNPPTPRIFFFSTPGNFHHFDLCLQITKDSQFPEHTLDWAHVRSLSCKSFSEPRIMLKVLTIKTK